MSRLVIGNAAIRLFASPEFSHMRIVAWGESDLLDAIGREASLPRMHPLERQKYILNALERDTRFEKFLFCCVDSNYRREMNVRAFRLKESTS